MLDVIIIGAGPAGLSAALILGRCRRQVLVIDAGEGRNKRAMEMHGYLTRDGIPPSRFLSEAREEVLRYGVALVDGTATHSGRPHDGSFAVRYRPSNIHRTNSPEAGESREIEVVSRRLLLATGMRDTLPAIDGIENLYGSSVHHCPYCDGWEHRDQRLVAYGQGDPAIGLALALCTWSPHVVACTDGTSVSKSMQKRAAIMNIEVCSEKIARLEGAGLALRRITFHDGSWRDCDALFFNTDQLQRSDLPTLLGCTFKPDGGVHTDSRQCTGIPGLYLAGDADKDVQFVIVAASEGATAAVAINRDLQEDDQRLAGRLASRT